MSINLEAERPILAEIPDNVLMALLSKGVHTPQIGKIAESEIADFCRGCEYLRPTNTCEKVDSNTQANNARNKNYFNCGK